MHTRLIMKPNNISTVRHLPVLIQIPVPEFVIVPANRPMQLFGQPQNTKHVFSSLILINCWYINIIKCIVYNVYLDAVWSYDVEIYIRYVVEKSKKVRVKWWKLPKLLFTATKFAIQSRNFETFNRNVSLDTRWHEHFSIITWSIHKHKRMVLIILWPVIFSVRLRIGCTFFGASLIEFRLSQNCCLIGNFRLAHENSTIFHQNHQKTARIQSDLVKLHAYRKLFCLFKFLW